MIATMFVQGCAGFIAYPEHSKAAPMLGLCRVCRVCRVLRAHVREILFVLINKVSVCFSRDVLSHTLHTLHTLHTANTSAGFRCSGFSFNPTQPCTE